MENFEFYYTPSQIEKINELKILIENDKYLHVGGENVFLSKFLYYTNWHVEKAFVSIHSFYDFKLSHPEWLMQRPLEKFREMFFYTQSKFLMTKPDRDGRVILVMKVIDEFERYPNFLQDTIQLDDFIFEALLLTEQAQKHGITIIYDLTSATKNILRVFSPSIARILNKKNNVLPWTTRRIHYIQKGALMNTVFSLFKHCLSKSLQAQIFSHDVNNLNNLRDLIGYDSLPAIYGGPTENGLELNYTWQHIQQNEDYLLKMQDYCKKQR